MARIWYSDAVWMFSSVLSLTIFRSSRSDAISSRIGATTRHGPHHGAQKSTSTGWSLSRTSAWKFVSVTSLMLPAMQALLPLSRTSESIVAAHWAAYASQLRVHHVQRPDRGRLRG